MTDITPPPELYKQWESKPRSIAFEAAYKAGADMELEACCEYMERWVPAIDGTDPSKCLRAARRPKPPSLKEQALAELAEWENVMDIAPDSPIRRALEQLDD